MKRTPLERLLVLKNHFSRRLGYSFQKDFTVGYAMSLHIQKCLRSRPMLYQTSYGCILWAHEGDQQTDTQTTLLRL